MIELQHLTFSFPDQIPIFQNFSWVVESGEIWSIIGPSGCGKSTLLYLLAGLHLPSSGWVKVLQKNIERPRPETGLIIQEYGLLPWATVKANIELGFKVRAFYGPDGTHAPEEFQPKSNINYWVERLRLGPHIEKFPSQLSGGQRQRTAIARTLALKPDLILMDEPFASLDAPTREGLQNLVLDLHREQGLTMVIVTHSIEEAAILGHKILILGNPPNTCPKIIMNPGAGQLGFRDSDRYTQICRKLRTNLDQRAAVGHKNIFPQTSQ